MASYNWGVDLPFLANGDFTSSGSSTQYRFVRLGSTVGQVARATGGSNPNAIGVAQEAPNAAGLEVPVRVWGVTQVYGNADSGSPITYGCYLTSASDGQAIPQGSTSGSAVVNAIALETLSSGCAVLISALLLPFGVKVAAS